MIIVHSVSVELPPINEPKAFFTPSKPFKANLEIISYLFFVQKVSFLSQRFIDISSKLNSIMS